MFCRDGSFAQSTNLHWQIKSIFRTQLSKDFNTLFQSSIRDFRTKLHRKWNRKLKQNIIIEKLINSLISFFKFYSYFFIINFVSSYFQNCVSVIELSDI